MAGSTWVSISGSLPSAWRRAAATPLDWAALSGVAVTTRAETAPRALADNASKLAIVDARAGARPLAASRPRNFCVVTLNRAFLAIAAKPLALSSAPKAGEPNSTRKSLLSARAAFSVVRSASPADRKRVGEGPGVSVLVDLGGRRSIKKTK